MRQFESPAVFPPNPDQFLHDLEEHPGGIATERTVGDVQDLIVKGAQSAQSVGGFADFQGVEQIDHRIGDAESLGGRHFLDAVRIQVGVEQIPEILPGLRTVQDVFNHLEQFMVFPVKKEIWSRAVSWGRPE